MPIENGGTGASTKKEAFNNLAFLGLNPISSLEEDTPQKWLELGSGYAKFDTNELMNNQPEQYMFVISFSHESSAIFQIGSLQSGSGVYYRTGNSNGWTVNWTSLLGANGIIPVANGGTGASTADTARANLNAQRRIPQYVSGEGADLDTDTFDFVLTTLTAKKHKALQDLGFGSFAFVWQFFYQEANNERGRTQFAKSYLTNKIATRYYSSNTKSWSNWDEIFTGDSIIPIGNGGTGANTRNNAFYKLSFLGDKPITSTA
uniref:Tail protein n=1 Tax=Myoviridae sp. ctjhW4 TaxID=2825162 RepID=A0A8S5PT10_9CAUD|nr:MAG TPA: tail protein [Myoviridae sp. ctjhW4]